MLLPSNASRHDDDRAVERAICDLRAAIQAWAEKHDLWFDCGFKDYLTHVGGEPPRLPVVTMICFDGPMQRLLTGEDSEALEPRFQKLLESLGYWYENRDYTSIQIYPDENTDFSAFTSYFHWQWVCGLIEEDFADVYQELYAHFAKWPDDLTRLHWRDFEILLARIFQAQGFEIELGPGSGDEGVDIRLLQRDPIGDVLTLVQAKRFGPRNKIDLQAVAALYGVGMAERADKSLFVTTSNYAPVARRFAARVSGHLTLATSKDVADWCTCAQDSIIIDKSKLVTPDRVWSILAEASQARDPRIVHAQKGFMHNEFALIIKETRHAALLMRLRCKTISDDGYGQQGYEVPLLEPALPLFNAKGVWRARRTNHDGRVRYWDGNNLYAPWNGEPCHFNRLD